MKSLVKNLDESTIAGARIGDNFHSAVSGDNYDSSRILLHDRIRSYAVAGAPIAVVPQRDAMYVAGSEDETSLKILFDLTVPARQDRRDRSRSFAPEIPMHTADAAWKKKHLCRW